MTRRKNIWFWTATSFGILIVFLLTIVMVAPRLVHREDIKEKIRSALSQKLKKDLEFESIHVFFFPPRVRFSDIHVLLGSEGMDGNAGSFSARFKILPLLGGKVKIESIVIKDPHVTIPVPESAQKAEKLQAVPRTPEWIRKKISHAAARFRANMPNAWIKIQNGSVRFTRNGEPLYLLQNLNAEIGLPPDKFKIHLSAMSNLRTSITFTGKIDADGSNAGGKLHISGLPLKPIVNYLNPGILNDVKSSRVTLKLDFESQTFNKVQGKLGGSVVHEKIPCPIEIEETSFVYSDEEINLNDLDIRIGKSRLGASSIRLELKEEKNVEIKTATAEFFLDRTLPWAAPLLSKIHKLKDIAADFEDSKGIFSFSSVNLKGPLMQPGKWKFSGRGTVENLVVETKHLPAPLKLSQGEFEGGREQLKIKLRKLTLQESCLSLSGAMKGFSSLDIKFNGAISLKTADWLKHRKLVPAFLNITAPVSVSDAHLVWKRPSQTVFFDADLKMQNAPLLALSLEKGPDRVTIKNLTVNDSASRASMSMIFRQDAVDVDFNGKLADGVLEKFIRDKAYLRGRIQGNFNLHVPTRHPMESRVRGTVRAGGLTYGKGLGTPIRVKDLSIQAEGNKIRIDSADLNWRETHIHTNGTVKFSSKGIVLDLAASTKGLDWKKVKRIIEEEVKNKEASKQEGVFGNLDLEAKVRLTSDYFKYDHLTLKPFHLVMNLQNKNLEIRLTRSKLCGIPAQATVRLSPEPFKIEAGLEARDKLLGPALDCILKTKPMTGEFDLSAEITAQGSTENLINNLQGGFSFSAEHGFFLNKYGLLARILSVVNITEILKGQAPDFAGEGFGYKIAKASGVIKDGVVTLNQAFIDGKSVDLAFTGSLDIPEEQIDLTVLVTPLKTVDTIIENIPVVGYLLGENFIAIPVRVRGDLSNPSVTPMSPSSVGKGVLGILERTLKLPLKVIQPFLPE